MFDLLSLEELFELICAEGQSFVCVHSSRESVLQNELLDPLGERQG